MSFFSCRATYYTSLVPMCALMTQFPQMCAKRPYPGTSRHRQWTPDGLEACSIYAYVHSVVLSLCVMKVTLLINKLRRKCSVVDTLLPLYDYDCQDRTCIIKRKYKDFELKQIPLASSFENHSLQTIERSKVDFFIVSLDRRRKACLIAVSLNIGSTAEQQKWHPRTF